LCPYNSKMKTNSIIPILALSEYVALIEKDCSKAGRYLFRGQLKDDLLLPKFLRVDTVPKGRQSPIIEEKMFRDFKRRGRPFLKIEPQNEYEWLALAQHHGMATRLLDWTSSALAALWFIVTSKRNISNDGIIWILRFDERDIKYPKKEELPYNIDETKIFCPTHIEDRFIAQGGWFTVHNYKRGVIRFDKEKNFKNKLQKIIIKRSKFNEIRFSLNQCGINKLSLFPDFGGLCEHINWINTRKYPGKIPGIPGTRTTT